MDKGCESVHPKFTGQGRERYCRMSLSTPSSSDAGIPSLETNTFNGGCNFATPARNNNGAIKSKSQARGLPLNFTPVSKYLFWRGRRSQSAGSLSNLEVHISPVYGEDPAQVTNGIDAILLMRTASSSTPTVSPVRSTMDETAPTPVRFIGDETLPSPVQSIVDETMPSSFPVSFIEDETMPHGCTFDSSFMTSVSSICATPTLQTYSGVTETDVGPVVDQDGSASEDSCNDLQNRTFTSPLSSTLETKSQSVFGSTHILFESPMSNVNQNTFDVDSPSNIINQTTSCKNNTFDVHQPCPSKCNDAEPDAKMSLLHNTFDAEPGVGEVSEAEPHSNAFQTKFLTTLSSTITLSESSTSVNLQKTFDMVSPNELTSRKNDTFDVHQPCPSKCTATTAQPDAKMSHLDNMFDAEPVVVAVSEAEPNIVRFSEARAGSDILMVSEAREGSDIGMVSEAGADVVALAAFAAEPTVAVTVTESGSDYSGDTHSSTLNPEGFCDGLSQSLACNLNETLDLREFLPSTSTPQLPQVNKFIMKQEMGKSSVVQRKLNEPDALLAPPTNIVGDRKTFLTIPSAKHLLPAYCAASKLWKCGAASIPGLSKTPHFGGRRAQAGLEATRNTAGHLPKGATGISRYILTPSAESADTVVSARSKIPGAGLRRPCPSGLPVAAYRPPLTRSMASNESTGTTVRCFPSYPRETDCVFRSNHTASAVPAVRTGRGLDQAKRHVMTSREPLPGAKRKKIGCVNCAQTQMQLVACQQKSAQTEMKLAASQQKIKHLQEELQKLREEKASGKGQN